MNVSLYVLSSEETRLYDGYVKNKRFKRRLPKINEDGLILLSDTLIDGGELPGVVITPGDDGGGGSTTPTPDPFPDPYPFPDPEEPVDPEWPWWDGGGGGGNSSGNTNPSVHTTQNILESKNVTDAIDILWQRTKDTLSADVRREAGFWLYHNSKTNEYVSGNIKYGPAVPNLPGTNGHITPGSSSPSSNGVSSDCMPVTFVHSHTSLSKIEGDVQREVGISPADIEYGKKYNIPLIVVDYEGIKNTEDGKYYVTNETGINDTYKIYTMDINEYK